MKTFLVFKKTTDGYENKYSHKYMDLELDDTSFYRSHLLAEPYATSFELEDDMDEDTVSPVKSGDEWVLQENSDLKKEKEEKDEKEAKDKEDKEKIIDELDALDEKIEEAESIDDLKDILITLREGIILLQQ